MYVADDSMLLRNSVNGFNIILIERANITRTHNVTPYIVLRNKGGTSTILLFMNLFPSPVGLRINWGYSERFQIFDFVLNHFKATA
jgi:hypothetical protein